MARIEVKEWWYEKEQIKAQKYNWTLCWGRVYEDENGKRVSSEEHGKYLVDRGRATAVGYYVCGDKIKETEKAIQVQLSFWNLRKAGRYVTDAPVEKRWKTWIPKSVLL